MRRDVFRPVRRPGAAESGVLNVEVVPPCEHGRHSQRRETPSCLSHSFAFMVDSILGNAPLVRHLPSRPGDEPICQSLGEIVERSVGVTLGVWMRLADDVECQVRLHVGGSGHHRPPAPCRRLSDMKSRSGAIALGATNTQALSGVTSAWSVDRKGLALPRSTNVVDRCDAIVSRRGRVAY